MKSSTLFLVAVVIVLLPATLLAQRERERAPREEPQPREKPRRLLKAMPRIFPATYPSRAGGEATNTSVRVRTSLTNTRFAWVEQQIRSLNPAATADLLSADKELVDQAIQQVTDEFKAAGFNETDAEEAVLAAWFYIRIKSIFDVTLRLLVTSTDDLGKIVINSDPDKADITVEGYSTGSQTLYQTWLPAGGYKIKLSKPGFVPVEGQCWVSQRKKSEFSKALSRQP